MGPVSWEDLVNAARLGNLVPGDLVWTEGMAQWQAAATIPGLMPPPGSPPAYGAPPMQPSGRPAARPPSLGDDAMMRLALPAGRSGWAIAAGYLGLLSLLGIFGPPALICGLLAIRDIRQHPEKHGLGRAWFGIVMGILGSIAVVAALVMALMPK